MPALDLALCLLVIRAAACVVHVLLRKVLRQIRRNVGGRVVRQ